jgi:pyrimidine deaminase RibD-like protein
MALAEAGEERAAHAYCQLEPCGHQSEGAGLR